MTQFQGEPLPLPLPRRCPRCGGLMTRPAGSNLYWHTDGKHPRCDITNIADIAGTQPVDMEVVTPAPTGRRRGKK